VIAASATRARPPMKLLIVDPPSRAAGYLRRGLAEQGCAVDIARDGADGRRLALAGCALRLMEMPVSIVDQRAVATVAIRA